MGKVKQIIFQKNYKYFEKRGPDLKNELLVQSW